MHHDLSLHSGERQVAARYDDIRADHRFRYEWADKKLPMNGFGLDVFCGNGYGTWLLSRNRVLLGIDGSSEAIRQAEQHYRRNSVFFSTAYYPFDLPVKVFDFVVSLESIEHVENVSAFFSSLAKSLKPGGVFIFSTPCEDKLPHTATGNHFHYRHYSFEETMRLAQSNGLALIDWAGQDCYAFDHNGMQGSLLTDEEMKLRETTIGQFLVVQCIKHQG
jgi:SAM-dependent methyltransferase